MALWSTYSIPAGGSISAIKSSLVEYLKSEEEAGFDNCVMYQHQFGSQRGLYTSCTFKNLDHFAKMADQDAEDWADESHTIHEVVGSGDVIYAWTQAVNTDETSGASVDVHTVSRFQFNADGQVVALANINESRFALEQMGYTITR